MNLFGCVGTGKGRRRGREAEASGRDVGAREEVAGKISEFETDGKHKEAKTSLF